MGGFNSTTSRSLNCLQVNVLVSLSLLQIQEDMRRMKMIRDLQVLDEDQPLLLGLCRQHTAAAEERPAQQATIQLLFLGVMGTMFRIKNMIL